MTAIKEGEYTATIFKLVRMFSCKLCVSLRPSLAKRSSSRELNTVVVSLHL